MSDPLFSVITPAYRAPRTIRATIDSVLAQTFGDFELIVIDDGSGDETPDVVAAYAEADPRVKLIRQENAGTAAARNTGLGKARGSLISFVDNDDVWLPTYLELAKETLERDPLTGLGYADSWPFDDESRRVHRLTSLEQFPTVDPDSDGHAFLLALLHINFVTASSVTVKREALDRVGGFRAELSGSDDWDMWLRIAIAGYRGVQIGRRPLVLLREHQSSQSKDGSLMVRSAFQTISGTMGLIEHDPEATRVAEASKALLEAAQQRLESPSRSQRVRARLRTVARYIKGRLIWRWRWRRPSAEVKSAFPRLDEI